MMEKKSINELTSSVMSEYSEFPLVFEPKVKPPKRPNLQRFQNIVRRIVSKGGSSHVILSKRPNKKIRFAKDIGNTLLNSQWRWILFSLCLAHAISWLLFAVLWMLISIGNDDLDALADGRERCIIGAKGFAGHLLLSIETQTTIGTGEIYPSEFCAEGYVVLALQLLAGVAIEGALVTAVYVKLSKPDYQNRSNLFSKKAVVCLRDGKLCLIFRVRDKEGKHSVMTSIKAYLVKRKTSLEGEFLSNYFVPLKLQPFGLLIWPLEIIHEITCESPLWDVSAKDLLRSRFEIIAVMKGDSITAGQSSQSKTSYLNKEINWGHRFDPCIEFDNDQQKYLVNYEKFNSTVEVDTPLCSAERLSEVEHELNFSPSAEKEKSFTRNLSFFYEKN